MRRRLARETTKHAELTFCSRFAENHVHGSFDNEPAGLWVRFRSFQVQRFGETRNRTDKELQYKKTAK